MRWRHVLWRTNWWNLRMSRPLTCALGWVLLCYYQIHHSDMVAQKQSQGLGGLVCAKNQRTWVEVRGRIVIMERVGLCMLLCCSQIQYSHMVTQKQERDWEGWTTQKTKGRRHSAQQFLLWTTDKARAKGNTYMWMSVQWKTKSQNWWIYVAHIYEGAQKL